MPEPIAVAFVEVRPSVDEFKANAEQDLRSQLGDVDVQGQLRLDGLAEARAEVSALTSDLQSISGQQLQFPGLEDAGRQATALTENLTEAAQVNLANLGPAADQMSLLSGEARVLADTVSGLPSTLVPDTAGIEQAAQQTGELASQTAGLGTTIGVAADGASALIAKFPQLAAGERAVAAATDATTAAVRRAAIEEEKTSAIRAKARRAASLGPLRLAGIGLGAGVGLFAATQALGALAEGLRVTGNDATTFEGKMRNMGASLLSGDVVGAFKALTNEAHDFSIAELRMIRDTPQAEAALQALGHGADLLKSRLEALQGISSDPVPQFIDTAIARAQASGDVGGELRAVEKAGEQIELAFAKVREVGPQQRELADQIRALQARREEIIRELDSPQTDRRQTFLLGVELGDVDSQVADLREQSNQLRGPVNAAYQELSEAVRDNKSRREQLKQEIADQRIGGIRQAFGDRALVADLAGAKADRAAILGEEQAILRAIVDEEKVGTAMWREAATELLRVNRDLESLAKQIADEQGRHASEMTSVFALGEAREAAVGTTAGLRRFLEAEKATILATIPVLKALVDAKLATGAELQAAYDRVAAINGQIESIQTAAAGEAKRHADEASAAADAASQKLADADAAFIRAIGDREQRGRNRQLIASASAGLADDIRVSNELQAIFTEQIATARKTINDARLRADTIAGLRTSRLQEEQNEAALRQQQRSERVNRREESLDLEIQIAQTNEQRGRELRAHRAKIEFLRERIEHTRRGSLERKRLRAEIAQEQAAIRDLKETAKDEAEESGASFGELAAAFLQQRRGFLTELASNIIPSGTAAFPTRTAPTPAPAPPPPSAPGPAPVSSPFGRPIRESGGDEAAQAAGAQALRDQGGQPPSAGQFETLIHLARNTNRLLGDIKTGVGHQQAKTSRALSKNAVEVNVGGV